MLEAARLHNAGDRNPGFEFGEGRAILFETFAAGSISHA